MQDENANLFENGNPFEIGHPLPNQPLEVLLDNPSDFLIDIPSDIQSNILDPYPYNPFSSWVLKSRKYFELLKYLKKKNIPFVRFKHYHGEPPLPQERLDRIFFYIYPDWNSIHLWDTHRGFPDNRTVFMIEKPFRYDSYPVWKKGLFTSIASAIKDWLDIELDIEARRSTLKNLESMKEAMRNNTRNPLPVNVVNTIGSMRSGLTGTLSQQILQLKEKLSRPNGAPGVGGRRKKTRRVNRKKYNRSRRNFRN